MKITYIICFSLLLIFYHCSSPTSHTQKTTSQISSTVDTSLSDSVKNLYKDDAALLALAEMNNDSILKSSIRLPKSLFGKYYSKLIAVHNASDIQEALEVRSIHNSAAKAMRRFVLGIDTSSQWLENLEDGKDVSGNSDIDQILSEYTINIISIDHGYNINFLYFETGTYVNAIPFLKLFENIENVVLAEVEGLIGGGNYISASETNGTIILKYSKGWGDCPAGCINWHFWEFSLNENKVTFLKDYGDKIP